MTPEQFCYWLQGRAELVPTPPNEAEWTAIRDHLQAVFKKVAPVRDNQIGGLAGVGGALRGYPLGGQAQCTAAADFKR